jgi:hypothetical protein
MKKITNVFSIGYRCNTDALLKKFNMRYYSSPFSYMVIDIETALGFIDNKFDNFLKTKYVRNNKFYWCENLWAKNLFFHNNYLPNENSNVKLNEWDKICVWVHHNISKEGDTIKRRYNRLLERLENKSESLLLIGILKIKDYDENKIFYNIDKLLNFVKNNKCNLLILIPLYKFNDEPTIVYNENNLLIVYFNSYYEKNGTAFTDNRIKWVSIKEIIDNNYYFEIDEK